MDLKEVFIQTIANKLTPQLLEIVETNGWDKFVNYNKKHKIYTFSMLINLTFNDDELTTIAESQNK